MGEHSHEQAKTCTAACPAHIDYEGADRCEARQPCDCCAPSGRERQRRKVERVMCEACGAPMYGLDGDHVRATQQADRQRIWDGGVATGIEEERNRIRYVVASDNNGYHTCSHHSPG